MRQLSGLGHALERTLARALVVALALLAPARLHAQSIGFTQVPPTSSATTQSTVVVTVSGQYGQDAACYAVHDCYYYPWDNGYQQYTETETLNGASVTSAFAVDEQSNCWSSDGYWDNYECDQTGTLTADLSYQTGSNTLAVSALLDNGSLLSASYAFTVTGASATLAVQSGGQATATGGAAIQSAMFTVQNSGSTGRTVYLNAQCGGSAIPSGTCAAWLREVYVGAGETVPVRVDFANPAAGGSGTVTLIATDPTSGTTLSTASDPVSVTASPRAIVSVAANSTRANFERSLCPDVAIVPNVAIQCGMLRVTHTLPAVTTYGKTYAPTLAYYGDNIRGPYLNIDVRIPAGQPVPQQVTFNVYRLNDDFSPAEASPWRTYPVAGTAWSWWGQGRASVWDLDYFSDTPGLHNVRVEVIFDNQVVSNTVTQVASAYRYYSKRPTREWTLLGLEQIVPNQPGGKVLWVDGDGSMRTYAPQSGNAYVAQGLLGPDSLIHDANGEWHRPLPNHARVVFDAYGRHSYTQNRFGRLTRFWYTDNTPGSALDSITVPGGQKYAFSNGFAQTVITAPGGRTVTLNHTANGQGVSSIVDPDGSVVQLEYTDWGPDVAIKAYTDERLTRTELTWDPCSHSINAASTPNGGQTETRSFDNYYGAGVCGGIRNQADYIIDGPRVDVSDVTNVSTDSTGAVTRIVNALGQATTVEHGDVRFPALPTRVVQPSGFAQTTAYDGRGHIASTTSWNPLGDGRNAMTRYTWDPSWDEITSVTLPEGETTRFGINAATGLRDWQEDARGASLRTWYYYTSDYFLRAVQPPGADCANSTTALGCQHFVADGMGNVQQILSETGGRTALTRNGVGQVYRTDVMIQPGIVPVAQTEESNLDALGRDTLHVSTGPAYSGAGQQQVFVRRVFDAAGADSIVDRWTTPDSAGIGHMITQYRHDRVGRVVQEIAPDNARDTTIYDPAGNVVSSTNRNGQQITFVYDALNRMRSRHTSPASYAAERVGIPAWMDGAYPLDMTTLTNAGLGQSYPWNHAGGYVVPAVVDTMVFDPSTGLMTDANNAYAAVHRAYYPNGQLYSESNTIQCWTSCPAPHVYADTISYDLNGRRKTVTYPSVLTPAAGANVNYFYATDGFLYGVTDLSGRTTIFDEHPLGAVSAVHFANGVQQSLDYFADGALRSDVVTTPNSLQLRNTALTYDLRGKMLTSDSHPYGGEYHHERMRYDGLGHLYVATRSDTLFAGIYGDSSKYSVDGFGNSFGRAGGDLKQEVMPLGFSSFLSTSSSTSSALERQHFLPATGRLWYTQDPTLVGDNTSPTTMRARVNTYDAAGNLLWTRPASTAPVSYNSLVSMADRRMYYGADGKLWAVDARSVTQMGNSGSSSFSYTRAFEEYRYDALGRRVLAKFDQECDNSFDSNGYSGQCRLSGIRRTIWDGTQELGEIQVPNAALENDLFTGQPDASGKNLAQYFGTVAYTFDGRLDQPLAVTRLRYATRAENGVDRFYGPFTFHPLWNTHGQTDADVTPAFPDTVCAAYYNPVANRGCISLVGQPFWVPQRYQLAQPRAWQGSLLEDKVGAGGLMYRRNRYYDATTGRFTQEDPIGLAGGLNVYGYAAGDPVNFSDPFGLCKGVKEAPTAPCEMIAVVLAESDGGLAGYRATASVIMNRAGGARGVVREVTNKKVWDSWCNAVCTTAMNYPSSGNRNAVVWDAKDKKRESEEMFSASMYSRAARASEDAYSGKVHDTTHGANHMFKGKPSWAKNMRETHADDYHGVHRFFDDRHGPNP